MIKKIGIKNVKIFEEIQWFDLKPFTILTGTNNSGKSTLQKILILLANSFVTKDNGNIDFERLSFSGDVSNKIGGFLNIAPYNQKGQKRITIAFEYTSDYISNIQVFLTYKHNNSEDDYLSSIEFFNNKNLLFSFKSNNIEDYYIKNGFKKIKNNLGDNNLTFQDAADTFIRINTYLNERIWTIRKYTKHFMIKYKNALLNKKNKGFLQDKQLSINNKLLENKELSLEEKEIIAQLEKEDIVFNSNLFEYGTWCFEYKHTNDILEFDNEAKIISEIFDQKYDELILPSLLSNLVLGDVDLLNNEHITNAQYLNYKETLIKNEIYTKNDFINAYKDFETEVFSIIINKSLPIDPLKPLFDSYRPKYFDEYISDSGVSFPDFIKYFEKTNNIISKILLPEIIEEENRYQKKLIEKFTNQVKEVGKENLRKRQKKETTSDNYKWASIIENLNKYKFKFIEDFFTQLNDFKNSISFLLQNQNKEIKRHYFSSDSDNINSLFYNYGKKVIENKGKIGYPNKSFFEKWLGYSEGFNIANEIDIQEISTPYNDELIGISYYLKNQNTLSPLGDNGLGINNFVLLLLQIVSTYKSTKKSILILEEPETGFHPAFQSKLADLLVEAHEKFEINFIIETHSEYFIRKLQFLIAKKELNKENVIIYYFNSPYNDKIPKGKNQIKALEVNEDGSLTGNFGTGFFDEADNIAIELYRIQKKNLN